MTTVARLQVAGRRFLSTGTWICKKAGDECKKTAAKLPCQKPTEAIVKKTYPPSRKVCQKLCMPCCPPAREPPECYYPYKKPPCKKFKPPRPAYSECKKDPVPQVMPCECDIPRPVCEKKKK